MSSIPEHATPEMSKWRQRLWPVYANEFTRFFPMVVIMFFVLFNYTIVRNVKDSLLINAPHSSAHVLPWAKVLIVTPAAILFVILYAKLSNVLSRMALYYACLIPFTMFFFLFAFVIYPYRDFLNASPETVLAWQSGSYHFFKNCCPMIGYWTFTCFYAMAELWGNIGVALLFWQFANDITPTHQAKRFYPIYNFWSNLGLVAAGLLLNYADPILDAWTTVQASGERDYSASVKLFCGFVTFGGFAIGAVYWWLNKYVLKNVDYFDPDTSKKTKKPKLSIGESVKFIMHSKYLGYIAVLVLAYGIIINILEVSWKDSVKEFFGKDAAAYSQYMGDVYTYIGILTMIFILASQNVMRLFGWKISASVTPWIALITGSLFFIFLVFKNDLGWACVMLNSTPLGVAVAMGFAQNTIMKSSKYALFDPTKEMTYIPLDEESKVKGKAAVDIVGGRAGKGGGSILNIAVHGLISNISWFFMTMGGILIGLCMWWMWAVQKLSKDYHKKLAEHESQIKK